MEAKVHRWVQRQGWDRASAYYESHWQEQLRPAQEHLLARAALRPGDDVLDVACGTGLVTLPAARQVAPTGRVVGVDISPRMVAAARILADASGTTNADFACCGAEELDVTPPFDVALCSLGLMYVPRPDVALAELHRILRPGGRAVVSVWGQRSRCGWADVFPIVDARVASDVCPMFFQLGTQDMLARAFEQAGYANVRAERLEVTLAYACADEALGAAFRGGPVALAYDRFDAATKDAVHAEYLRSIDAFRVGEGYRIPGEFVVAAGTKLEHS